MNQARHPQDQRLLEARRYDLHPDRQSVVRQTGRCGRRRQAHQSDQISRRDPVDIVLEVPAVDLAGKFSSTG